MGGATQLDNHGAFWGQADLEDYLDDRYGSDEEFETDRRIKFPKKIYGRDSELAKFHSVFDSVLSGKASNAAFLGGLSGTGKSALVSEFIKQLSRKNITTTVISGKFGQMNSGDPFSAISRALNQYVVGLTERSTKAELRPLKSRLAEVNISAGTETATVLSDTLIPALADLLKKASSGRSRSRSRSMAHTTMHDLNAIKFAFENFIKALATGTQPVVLFIDDMQWADDASIQLIGSLLKNKALSYMLFVGAYRTNEVSEEHEFSKLMKDVEEAKEPGSVSSMEIFSLSPDSIAQFIADSINRKTEEVDAIAEAVFSKTLGNIFFVKQALDELVRKNALYYDVVFFRWQFGDVSQVELEKFLSDDVIGMVQSKMKTLPLQLQKALSLAAYTNNTIDTELLMALLTANFVDIDIKGLCKLMKTAYTEGLVLIVGGSQQGKGGTKVNEESNYRFAHDRIREAACALIPDGHEKHQMLRNISMVLLDRGAKGKDDWMLFTAARHLNAIPPSLTHASRVVELNLKVGKIAAGKGAFNEAVVFLRVGDERLDPATCWKNHYKLCLEVKNTLMEAVLSIGNNERALEIAGEILGNATSLSDKGRAHFVQIEALSENNTEYEKPLEAALDILKQYKIDIPLEPSDGQVKREKFRLRIALRGRSLGCMSTFPVATKDTTIAKIRVAQMATRLANFGKKANVTAMLGTRVLREAVVAKTISKDLPSMLVMLGGPLRQEENFESAIACANAAILVMDRFPGERGVEYLKGKMSLYGTLSCLQLPFKDAIETFLELNKQLLAKGVNGMGLGAGMLGMYAFLNASLPLDALLEPKLLLLEETAANLGMKTFVVVFSLIRQCLYNLQGGKKASSKPTEIKGAACSEDEVRYLFEGQPQKMTNRDIAIIRLQLAVIFNHETTMEQMLERLDEFPVYDMPVERQHLRMSYMGFAALILRHKQNEKFARWAKTSMDFFEKLSRFGSPNAQPVYLCMKALQKPSVAAYDEAIDFCSDAGLFNLAGLMSERCGLWLLEKQKGSTRGFYSNEDYLKRAMWCYHDWGATAKVQQLQTKFRFLSSAAREKAPSHLASLKRNAAMLGMATQQTEASDTQ